jgi:adenosylmethionine-8-amino-7-oxononanoate aminotransferase
VLYNITIPTREIRVKKTMSVQRQSAVFHRLWDKEYPTASGGEGVYIVHPDGSRTLDGCSGAAVSCLGHGHAVVIEAIVQQARKFAYAHTVFFTSDPAEELAQILINQSDEAFTKVMFVSSGNLENTLPMC